MMTVLSGGDVELRSSLNGLITSGSIVSVASLFLQQWLIYFSLAALFSIVLSVAFYGRQQFWNILQASVLGSVFSFSLIYAYRHGSTTLSSIFAIYAASIAFFHYSEFLATALTNRKTLTPSSYLLNHSFAYWIAALTSWVEFLVESYVFPQCKILWITCLGLVVVAAGEVLRKLAMIHARESFTHLVAVERRPEHVLVTNGVYAFVRHPGYLGWMLWCIGTQLLLCNPVCVVIYAVVAWSFFNERIYWEEQYLILFFGSQYVIYQKKVPTGIPFVKGFNLMT
uniref:Protein-S-isoprenylcysteine O-methyltransferase n=1 Tax=Parascaris univalens TaxID=6257 RepID=A0A915CKW8_PARUN